MKKICTLLICVVMLLTSNVTVFATEMNEMQEEMTYESDLLKRFGLSSGDAANETSEEVVATSSTPIVYAADEELINEGKKLFDNFLEVSSFIENDSSWSACMEYYNGRIRRTYTSIYEENVANATSEQMEQMSTYEVFVYIETYLRFADMVGTSAPKTYINTGEKGTAPLKKTATIMWEGNNKNEVIAAYDAFIAWQIEYYRTYNFPYNFITGRSYAEEMSSTYVPEPSQEAAEDIIVDEMQEIMAELSTDEIQEIQQELVAEGILDEQEAEEVMEAITEEKEPGIWDDVFENLKKSWFTLGLLVVLVVAYLVVRFIRTRRAIDEMTDEGK